MSVSPGSTEPLVQVVGMQSSDLQVLAAPQSPFTLQASPLPHGEQLPPQSTSVSLPSLLPSPQVDVHFPDLQVLLLPQSPLTEHVFPSAQAPQLPPQSWSVSLPLRTPSVQLGGKQVV